MSNFGSRSNAQKKTCWIDLQKILDLGIERSNVDFGLHQGGRSIGEQQDYFDNGKSKINPRKYSSPEALARDAKHIVIIGHEEFGLSRAIDLHVSEKYNNKSLAWDEIHLAYVAGVLTSCAKELYEKGEISHILRWGGDFDSDGIIGHDQTLRDFPHYELIKPE